MSAVAVETPVSETVIIIFCRASHNKFTKDLWCKMPVIWTTISYIIIYYYQTSNKGAVSDEIFDYFKYVFLISLDLGTQKLQLMIKFANFDKVRIDFFFFFQNQLHFCVFLLFCQFNQSHIQIYEERISNWEILQCLQRWSCRNFCWTLQTITKEGFMKPLGKMFKSPHNKQSWGLPTWYTAYSIKKI